MTMRTQLMPAQLPLARVLVLDGVVSRHTVEALGDNAQYILKDHDLSVPAAQRLRDAADTLTGAALARARSRPLPLDEARLVQKRAQTGAGDAAPARA